MAWSRGCQGFGPSSLTAPPISRALSTAKIKAQIRVLTADLGLATHLAYSSLCVIAAATSTSRKPTTQRQRGQTARSVLPSNPQPDLGASQVGVVSVQ
jgi:hypothetical protein